MNLMFVSTMIPVVVPAPVAEQAVVPVVSPLSVVPLGVLSAAGLAADLPVVSRIPPYGDFSVPLRFP